MPLLSSGVEKLNLSHHRACREGLAPVDDADVSIGCCNRGTAAPFLPHQPHSVRFAYAADLLRGIASSVTGIACARSLIAADRDVIDETLPLTCVGICCRIERLRSWGGTSLAEQSEAGLLAASAVRTSVKKLHVDLCTPAALQPPLARSRNHESLPALPARGRVRALALRQARAKDGARAGAAAVHRAAPEPWPSSRRSDGR